MGCCSFVLDARKYFQFTVRRRTHPSSERRQVLLCPGHAGSAVLPRERKFLLFVSVFGLDLLVQVVQ